MTYRFSRISPATFLCGHSFPIRQFSQIVICIDYPFADLLFVRLLWPTLLGSSAHIPAALALLQKGTGRRPLSLSGPIADSFIVQIGVTVGEAKNSRRTSPIGGSHPVKGYKHAHEILTSHQTE